MTRKEKLKSLVVFALTTKTTINKVVSLGKVTEAQAKIIKSKTGINLEGYERIIDKSGVRHTLKLHGDKKTEAARGQIAVTGKDFEKIPKIVKSKNVIFSGKNKIGRDCILYQARIGCIYYYVEEIRIGKKQLALNTMYKKK